MVKNAESQRLCVGKLRHRPFGCELQDFNDVGERKKNKEREASEGKVLFVVGR